MKELTKNYVLCPSHYLSALALHCNEMFSMKKIVLKLISEVDIYFFF